MERIRRLAAFWNWLPAFRVVAETEHLPTASEELHVSPSALSRSIRLLEDAIGVELFDRRGRNLFLTDAGAELLVVVRRAMRGLDDGIESITAEDVGGPVRISAPGPFASLFVLPALRLVRKNNPRVVPVISSLDAATANSKLLGGALDIALLDDPIPHPQLVIEKVADIGHGVYCGADHPLFGKKKLRLQDIVEFPFAVPPEGADDHWPRDVPRKVGARMSQLQIGIDFCCAGELLAVLPDPVARAYVERNELRRLAVGEFSPTSLYAVHRASIGSRTKIDVLLPALREVTF